MPKQPTRAIRRPAFDMGASLLPAQGITGIGAVPGHTDIDTQPHVTAGRHAPQEIELFRRNLLYAQVGRAYFVCLR